MTDPYCVPAVDAICSKYPIYLPTMVYLYIYIYFVGGEKKGRGGVRCGGKLTNVVTHIEELKVFRVVS